MARPTYRWQLPAAIERRLGTDTYGRQRAIFEEGHLLIILHEPPKPDEDTRRPRVFLRDPQGKVQCNGQPEGEAKLRRLLTSYQKLFDTHDDACDSATTASELFRVLETILPVNRASTNLYHALQSAREQVGDDKFLIAVRDQAYELSRSFDLLVADAKLTLDYRIARNAELQTAQAAKATDAQHKLNVLAAITFPLMAIATIFGMNLRHGLEDQAPVLFWLVFAGGFLTGMLTKVWVTATKGKTPRV